MKSTLLVNAKLLGKELGLLLRFPSAIPQLINGPYAASLHIERLLRERYHQRPIEMKHVFGFNICLNPKAEYISPYIAQAGFYELATTEIFRLLLQEGDTVMDVGANIGWYTLIAASIVGDVGAVLSFEPEAKNFSLLSKSVALNHFKNVLLFDQIVSDADGLSTLYMSPNNSLTGSHTIAKDLGGPNIEMQSKKLDEIVRTEQLGKIKLLKIDVEGAEPQVISGASSTIAKDLVEYILLEWNPEAWMPKTELVEMLFGNFRFYQIRYFPTVLKRLERGDLQGLRGNILLERL